MDKQEKRPAREKPPEEIEHPDGQLEHPTVKREHTDAYAGWVIGVLALCLMIGALDVFLVWHFFLHNQRQQSQLKASTYPLAPAPSLTLPREPRLDPLNRIAHSQEATAYQMLSADLSKLNQVGPAEKGFVRIPIDEAMKLVVARLPVAKQSDPAAGKDSGLRYGGGPNSGRVFDEEAP